MEPDRGIGDVLFVWRRLLIRITAAGAAVSVIVSLLLPRWYTASAVLTPPGNGETGLGLLAAVGDLGSIGGLGRARNLLQRSPDVDATIGVLKSRRLRGEVVDAFDLVQHYDAKSREHAIKELGKHLTVDTTPEGFVDVRVEAHDARMAADLTNGLVAALDRYNRSTSVADAKRTSEFIETCLAENRERMDVATKELREFQEQHGAVQITEQARVTVEAMAALEAERTELVIRKGVLQHYASGEDPEIQEIDAKIGEIDKRMSDLKGSGGTAGPAAKSERGGTARSGRNPEVLLRLTELPGLAIRYAELQREVLSLAKVYEFLVAQREEARIREAKDLETVKVLDEAVPPIRRSRPRRTLIVVLSTLVAMALALAAALVVDGLRNLTARRSHLAEARELRWLFRLADRIHAWGASEDATTPRGA